MNACLLRTVCIGLIATLIVAHECSADQKLVPPTGAPNESAEAVKKEPGTIGAGQADAKKSSEAELAKELLVQWKNERNRLRSGVAVVKATDLEFHPRSKERVRSESEFATAFDWKGNLFRFDRRYGGFGGQLIRSPVATANRSLPDGSVRVGPPGEHMNGHVFAFDIRCLGMTTKGERESRRLELPLDDVATWFGEERKLTEIKPLVGGRYRIRMEQKSPDASARFTIWLNKGRGASPEEFQIHVLDSASGEWILTSQVLTEWTAVDGIYVPTRCEESRFAGDLGTARSTLTLNWSNVNKAVEPERFHPADFDTFLADAKRDPMEK